ncbi:MAG: hypothetical protein PVS3B2_00630 [Candidatus Dormibacteraceae bacterium]
MKKLKYLLPAISFAVAMLASHPVTASAAVTVAGTVNGGGTSVMTDVAAQGFKGVSSFSVHATLFSNGSAIGHFDCVDHMNNPPGYPGNIFGDITSWSKDGAGLHLYVTNGSLVGHGSPVAIGGLPFTVTIQSFGGAGVGHWTLDLPGVPSPYNAGPICQELLTSGQIVARWN